MGRHSEYSKEKANEICALLIDGKNLKEICSMESMPSLSCVMHWIADNQEFKETYALAREVMLDNYGTEKLIDLADNVNLTAESINKARLQIDTRKWVMSKLLPRKYGDNAVLTHTGNVQVEQLIIQRTPKTIEHQLEVRALPVIDADVK